MSILFFITNIYSIVNLIVLPVSIDSHFDLNTQDNNDYIEVQQIKNPKEIFPTKISSDSLGVDISAESAIVKDVKTGKVLWSKNSDEVRSIASITKLMSAIILIDANPDWNKVVDFDDSSTNGDFNKLKLLVGDRIKFEDVFNASILSSSNSGIEFLIKNSGISREEFITRMNKKAKEMGLIKTFFKDPTGLSNDNISSANEVVIFASKAFSYDRIRSITSKKVFSFSVLESNRVVVINNTNSLIGGYLNINAGKTGTTDDAGFCLVSEISYQDKGPIIGVVLGSKSHFERFSDIKTMVFWVFNNYLWK